MKNVLPLESGSPFQLTGLQTPNKRERAEAAAMAWIAKQEGEGWSEADRSGFDAWIAQSLDHRVAWLRLMYSYLESSDLPLNEKLDQRRTLATRTLRAAVERDAQ